MSRNQDRLGGVQQHDTSAPTQAAADAGFAFVVPTEFVELPSGGKYYPPGHALHGESAIEIKQMTAKEEDMLTSKTLLKKGIAIDRVLQSLIVDKRIDPDSLLIGDRNAMIVATRVSGYGSDYNTSVTCPACAHQQKYSFDLNQADIFHGRASEEPGLIDNGDGTFTTTLPRTKVNVAFKLLTGNDEKNVISGVESDRKRKIHERGVTRQLVSILVSVNGDDSPQALNYLVENIPSIDSRHLRLMYKIAAPNIDLNQHFECENCDHEQEMEVPLNADFFWPDR